MLEFTPLLCGENEEPFDKFEWLKETVTIYGKGNKVIYECVDAEFPKDWTWVARNTVASKYFRESRLDPDDRETSVKEMVSRVVSELTKSGIEQGYFNEAHGSLFANEITMIFTGQYASLNSPVWFNVGVPGIKKPQASACFINSVEDSMHSIMDLGKISGLIFKEGSGNGVNLSPLRGSQERVRGGGTASGPVSFMKGYDGFAQVILSGGRTRRAARMVILDVDHPDIEDFITCKAEQEKIAELLVAGGLSKDFRDVGGAYDIVKHQTGNNSVRASDNFMKEVQQVLHYGKDPTWSLVNRVDGKVAELVSVKHLFRTMAESAHRCGDPGMQFSNHINAMNTCSNDAEILASNPCSEFLWLNDSACNLASINLCKFLESDGTFNVKLFSHIVRILIIAQDILVEYAGYPTPELAENSRVYRPLGLGYSNLGGLLMLLGLPYDSDPGRKVAASITSLLTGHAYDTSAELAVLKGPFERYEANADCMEEVLARHSASTKKLDKDVLGLAPKAIKIWRDVMGLGCGRRKNTEATGFRNCQVTLLAPCGTIAFMMDSATSGVEPDIGLIKTKLLVGGSEMKYANPNLRPALNAMDYDQETIQEIINYVEEHEHVEGSALHDSHLAVFDCSSSKGNRRVSVEGHIGMIAAVQPFLSGGISKTYNMPNETTVPEIEHAFLRAWEAGIKCITVYRDGSKMSEPMRMREVIQKAQSQSAVTRNYPPDDMDSKRHGFKVGGHKGYLHVSLDPITKQPLEIFIRVARFGTTVGGLLDSYAKLFSYGLQHGIPLEVLTHQMEGSNFPPSGFTQNPLVPKARSILDYISRFLRAIYLDDAPIEAITASSPSIVPLADDEFDLNEDMCPECGSLMIQTGTCQRCNNCSYSDGVCG